MGITTGWGGGSRLVNIVGRKRALQLLLTANKVNYGNALDIGLIDSSISDYEVSKRILIQKKIFLSIFYQVNFSTVGY